MTRLLNEDHQLNDDHHITQQEIDELTLRGKIDETLTMLVNAKNLLQSIDLETAEDFNDELQYLLKSRFKTLYEECDEEDKEERRLITLDCNICNVAFDVEEDTESAYTDYNGVIICDGCR